MNPNWFENSLCHVHLDMHMPAFPKGALSRFNAQRLIRVLKDAYVECAVVFAKDHFGMSFYPTRYGYPHPKMRGDILGELLAEGARQDISMIVYYSVGWDRKTGDEHPDWIMIDQKGQRVNDDGPYPSLCFNSPYIRKMVIPQVSEIVRRYSFRGFFFDIVFMPDQVCFCPFCRKMFEARYAQPLDSSMIGSMRKELDEFRGETIARFVRDIQWEVKRLNPSLWIGHNGPPQLIPDRRIVDGSDLIVIESQPILPGGHHGHSLRCRAARTLGMPFQGITVRFQEGWGQASLKETVQLKQEFASIAVHGGKVSCGDQMNVDGSLEKGVWRRIREALSFLHERRHLFLGFSANRYLALVGDEKYSFPFPSYEILPQVLGAHKILNEGHFQFDVLTMERLPSRMHDYACLVLPENIPVGEKMRDEITEFVADGGRLILFGNALESFLDRQ